MCSRVWQLEVCSRAWQLKSVQSCLAIEKMRSRVWQLKSVQSCLAIEKCAVVFGSWKVCSCVGQLKSVLSCLAIEKCAVVFCNWKVCSRVWQLKSAQSCLAIEECADVFGNWKVCRRVWQLKSVKTCFANLFFEVSKCTCNASKQLTILFLPLCRCVFSDITPTPTPPVWSVSTFDSIPFDTFFFWRSWTTKHLSELVGNFCQPGDAVVRWCEDHWHDGVLMASAVRTCWTELTLLKSQEALHKHNMTRFISVLFSATIHKKRRRNERGTMIYTKLTIVKHMTGWSTI